jgi:S1-C subfamily serine protease
VAARVFDGADHAGSSGEQGGAAQREARDATAHASSSTGHAHGKSNGRAARYLGWVRIQGALLVVSVLLAAGCGGSSVGSVGAVLGRDNDTHTLYVREVPPGLGAEDAGLLAGDQIIMIDGRYVRDMNEKEIRSNLRGEAGSKVALTILRGNDVRHVRVTRSERRTHEAIQPRERKLAE